MIFSVSHPPRMMTDGTHLEIVHRIVVDDSDMELMTGQKIGSYFPHIRPGFKRVNILHGHDDTGSQMSFVVIDRETGE